MAERFAALGSTIVIWDLNAEGARTTAHELAQNYGVKTHAEALDLSVRDQVYAAGNVISFFKKRNRM